MSWFREWRAWVQAQREVEQKEFLHEIAQIIKDVPERWDAEWAAEKIIIRMKQKLRRDDY